MGTCIVGHRSRSQGAACTETKPEVCPLICDGTSCRESDCRQIAVTRVIEAPHGAVGKNNVLEHGNRRTRKIGCTRKPKIGGDYKMGVTKFHCRGRINSGRRAVCKSRQQPKPGLYGIARAAGKISCGDSRKHSDSSSLDGGKIGSGPSIDSLIRIPGIELYWADWLPRDEAPNRVDPTLRSCNDLVSVGVLANDWIPRAYGVWTGGIDIIGGAGKRMNNTVLPQC